MLGGIRKPERAYLAVILELYMEWKRRKKDMKRQIAGLRVE